MKKRKIEALAKAIREHVDDLEWRPQIAESVAKALELNERNKRFLLELVNDEQGAIVIVKAE